MLFVLAFPSLSVTAVNEIDSQVWLLQHSIEPFYCDKLDIICQVGFAGAWHWLVSGHSDANCDVFDVCACVCAVWMLVRTWYEWGILTASSTVICDSCASATWWFIDWCVQCPMTELKYLFSCYLAYFEGLIIDLVRPELWQRSH